MTLNLKDKVVIVVGAAGTIGSAVAKEFAKEGAKVVAADIRAAELNEVAEAIKAEGGEVTAIEVDVRRMDSVKAMVAKTVELYAAWII